MRTFELDTPNPDCLYSISTVKPLGTGVYIFKNYPPPKKNQGMFLMNCGRKLKYQRKITQPIIIYNFWKGGVNDFYLEVQNKNQIILNIRCLRKKSRNLSARTR